MRLSRSNGDDNITCKMGNNKSSGGESSVKTLPAGGGRTRTDQIGDEEDLDAGFENEQIGRAHV